MIHREPPATHRGSRALAAGCVRRSQVCRFKLDSSQIALRGRLYMFRFCGTSSAPGVAHGPRSEAQVWRLTCLTTLPKRLLPRLVFEIF